MDQRLTYANLDTLSRALGAWLQSKGLAPGDRVAVMLPNVLQNPVCIAGILRAGYVVVNVNPLYTPRELTELLREAEEHHGAYEATAPKHHWSHWYAGYIVARERGKTPEDAIRYGALNVEKAFREEKPRG